MRLHYPATDQKNNFFLLLSQQRLTGFNPQKNHRFLHQTRRFVQSIEGLCFLKENNMNTKLTIKSSFPVLLAPRFIRAGL